MHFVQKVFTLKKDIVLSSETSVSCIIPHHYTVSQLNEVYSAESLTDLAKRLADPLV